jgi:predicted dinucleotide-binding enzyme
MRIGVIGSGEVGQALARGLKAHGYETRIASRSPEKLTEFSKSSEIQTGTFADVAAWAEGVVLAVKGDVAEAAVREAGAANLSGKLVIDTTNPIALWRVPPPRQ